MIDLLIVDSRCPSIDPNALVASHAEQRTLRDKIYRQHFLMLNCTNLLGVGADVRLVLM